MCVHDRCRYFAKTFPGTALHVLSHSRHPDFG